MTGRLTVQLHDAASGRNACSMLYGAAWRVARLVGQKLLWEAVA